MPKNQPVPAVAPSAAGRPQPQTTLQPPGGPFLRHSEEGAKRIYVASNLTFGALVGNPLTQVPGYIQGWRVGIQAAGGSGVATVAASADAPFNVVQTVNLWDAFGTTLVSGPGYEVLYLIPKYSGQFADPMGVQPDIKNLPSFSNVATGANASGNFAFRTYIPLEFSKAIGTIGGANASLQPKLQFQLNPATVVYTTAPTTPPSLTFRVNERFYWLPESVDVAPPMEGTTCQWFIQPCTPPIGSGASNLTVSIPRLGGYLTTLIFILRDSTGARIDAWPDPLSFYIDGVSRMDLDLAEIFDDIYMQFGGITRDTGTIVFTRKTSLSQAVMGLFDSLERTLSTNPGTSVQIGGSWGTVTNAPAQLNVMAGIIVPVSTLVQGLPEV